MDKINLDASPLYTQLRQMFSPDRAQTTITPVPAQNTVTAVPATRNPHRFDDGAVHKFLHDRVRDHLANRHALPKPLGTGYDQWGDAQHVAERLTAMAQRLLSSTPPGHSDSTLADVRNALAQGAADTRAATTPSPTQDQALTDIQQQVQDHLSALSMQGVAYHQSQKTSLKLVTREGDVVTIDMARKMDFSYGHAENGSGSASVFSYASETSLRYSVKGDLNDQELQEIDKLLGKLDGLADGTMTSPQELAGSIDNNVIGNFSLRFNDSQDFAAVSQTDAHTGVNVQDIFSKLFENIQGLQDLFKSIIDTKNPPSTSSP